MNLQVQLDVLGPESHAYSPAVAPKSASSSCLPQPPSLLPAPSTSPTMPSYTFSDDAYLKLFFHCAKYPHRAVNGVLLGTEAGDEVQITDAVPLLHHWTHLSPMMEIGLDLVSVASLA